MTGDEPEQKELEAQMETATDAIRAAVVRLLREGKVHPQVIVLAAARVAGELGASAALAAEQNAEELLGDVAEFLQHAGRAHHAMLQAEMLPVAGSA
jgi:hypothetical protein